jgi:hypothetical protein
MTCAVRRGAKSTRTRSSATFTAGSTMSRYSSHDPNFDPVSGVLKNRLGITDAATLEKVEAALVATRAQALKVGTTIATMRKSGRLANRPHKIWCADAVAAVRDATKCVGASGAVPWPNAIRPYDLRRGRCQALFVGARHGVPGAGQAQPLQKAQH